MVLIGVSPLFSWITLWPPLMNSLATVSVWGPYMWLFAAVLIALLVSHLPSLTLPPSLHPMTLLSRQTPRPYPAAACVCHQPRLLRSNKAPPPDPSGVSDNEARTGNLHGSRGVGGGAPRGSEAPPAPLVHHAARRHHRLLQHQGEQEQGAQHLPLLPARRRVAIEPALGLIFGELVFAE